MELLCPHCGGTIKPADTDPKQGVARCPECENTFSLVKWASQARPRPTLTCPKHVRVTSHPGRLRVDIAWRNKRAGCTFMVTLLFAFMAALFALALMTEAALIGIAAMVVFGSMAVGMAYQTLARLLNRTRVELTADALHVRIGPIPWWGHKRMDPASVSQFYCRERRIRGPGDRGPGRVLYDLMAVGHDGEHWAVVRDMESRDTVLFTEQALERAAKLRDRPVEGEVAR